MVVLGSLVNLSIVTLFLAGFVPAFVLALALFVLIADACSPSALAGQRPGHSVRRLACGTPRSHAERPARSAVRRHLQQVTTVTEAALLAVVYSLVAGIALGGIRRTELFGQLAQSGVVTATTLWVLAAASAFAWILVREWVPQMLGEWIRQRRCRTRGIHGADHRAVRRHRRAARGAAGAADFRSDPLSRSAARSASIPFTTGSSSLPRWASRFFCRR